ncbi:YhcN/YlaJ family sporulation lipoprotein [Marinicrinis sediminis]|uniref:YhcN/YlaJ family sporulation lipoprotein n=1 Tax=Marinicrinis sediminis TaxID=1652465 RepID=A0ABW5R6B8_9BACL
MLKLKWIRLGVLSAAILSLAACNNANNNGAMDNDNRNNNQTGQFGMNRYMNDDDLGMNRDLAGNRGQVRNQSRNQTYGYEDGPDHYYAHRNKSDYATPRSQANGMRAKGMNNGNRNGMNGRNGDMHANTRMEKADDIAEKLSAMKEIDSANVLLTDDNAYIAVELEERMGKNKRHSRFNRADDTDQDVTDRVKTDIANQVKKMKPDINNVYVSANPDFMNRMNGFMDRMDDGNPVRGMMDEFNSMMNRIFPANALRDGADRDGLDMMDRDRDGDDDRNIFERMMD